MLSLLLSGRLSLLLSGRGQIRIPCWVFWHRTLRSGLSVDSICRSILYVSSCFGFLWELDLLLLSRFDLSLLSEGYLLFFLSVGEID